MKIFNKIILFSILMLILSNPCFAKQTRVIVAPVNIQTVNSVVGIYPNISDYIANDIINELNKNLNFDAIDLNSIDKLMMSQGLWEDYRQFLKNYKDRGIIDYKICDLLQERLGINKIVLVSSGFSMQSLMLKRPFLYKIGLTEVNAIESFYRMDVSVAMVDTQSCLIDFESAYKENFRAKNFEVPSNSLSDNVVSTEKIKKFSGEIAEETATEVFAKTSQSAYTNVKSNIISTSNKKINSREGAKTRDGHFTSANDDYLKNKRKESFKNWTKERIDF